jgi:hypothetical protein
MSDLFWLTKIGTRNLRAQRSRHWKWQSVETAAFSLEPLEDFVFAEARTPHLFPRSVAFQRGKRIGDIMT